MNDRIAAIVLSVSDYKDNDSILRVLSREHGVLSLVARSSRKITSKNRFLPLCLYEFLFDFREGKTIFTLHNGKLLEDFYIDNDIEELAYRNIFPDVCLKFSDLADAEYYDALLQTLRHMKKEEKFLSGALFFAFLSRDYGVAPMVDGCAVCGKKQVVALSNRHGGFLCSDHLYGEEPADILTLKKFRLLNKASFEHFPILLKYDYDRRDFFLMADFFFANADIRLKSYEFYRSL